MFRCSIFSDRNKHYSGRLDCLDEIKPSIKALAKCTFLLLQKVSLISVLLDVTRKKVNIPNSLL